MERSSNVTNTIKNKVNIMHCRNTMYGGCIFSTIIFLGISYGSASSFVSECPASYTVCEPGQPPFAIHQRDGYATLAYVVNGTPQLYRSHKHVHHVPFCVGWTASGEVLVGEQATSAAHTCSICDIDSIIINAIGAKPLVSTAYNATSVDNDYVVSACGGEHSVHDLQQIFITHLKTLAEDYFNATFDKAVFVIDEAGISNEYLSMWRAAYQAAGLQHRFALPSRCLARYFNVSDRADETAYVAIIGGKDYVRISLVVMEWGIYETLGTVNIPWRDATGAAHIEQHIIELLQRNHLPLDTLQLYSEPLHMLQRSPSKVLAPSGDRADEGLIVSGAAMIGNDMHCHTEYSCLCIEVLELSIGVRTRHNHTSCGVDTILLVNTLAPTKRTVQLIGTNEKAMLIELLHGCDHVLTSFEIPTVDNEPVDLTLEVDVNHVLHATADNNHGTVIHQTIRDGIPRLLITDELRQMQRKCNISETCEAQRLLPSSIMEPQPFDDFYMSSEENYFFLKKTKKISLLIVKRNCKSLYSYIPRRSATTALLLII